MNRVVLTLAAFALIAVQTGAAKADFLIFGGRRGGIVFEGTVTSSNSPSTVSVTTKKYGTLYFSRGDVAFIKHPEYKPNYLAKVKAAVKGEDSELVFKLAGELLRRGWLEEYYAAIDKVLEMDPDHKIAKRVKAFKEKLDTEIPESDEEESKARKIVKSAESQLKVHRTKHFIILHDTDKDAKASKGKNAEPFIEQRSKVVEQVYETFLLFFLTHDVELPIPKERMRVVLFEQKSDFKAYAESLSPGLSSASGFWTPKENISIFFNHGTDPSYVKMREIVDEYNTRYKRKLQGRGAGELTRFVKTLDVLSNMTRDEYDLEVLTHEMTHQLAGTTGLFPPEIRTPRWVHEGLATYFESPKGASWAGIGAVSEERLDRYRETLDHKKVNFDKIVTDEAFLTAKTFDDQLDCYGFAWSATHFLVEKHFKKLVKFYKELALQPRETIIPAETIRSIFTNAFGMSPKEMEFQYLGYMESVKKDIEKAAETGKVR